MPLKIKCNHCEKVLVVPDAARGKAVKCPACQGRIVIPAVSEASSPAPAKVSAAKASASKPKPKKEKAIVPVNSEEGLAKLDFSRAEDRNARICIKCGYDMKYQDEEDTECPQCGYASDAGGMGVKGA